MIGETTGPHLREDQKLTSFTPGSREDALDLPQIPVDITRDNAHLVASYDQVMHDSHPNKVSLNFAQDSIQGIFRRVFRECFGNCRGEGKMAEPSTEEKVRVLKHRLALCDNVAVLTGAGISAESGVPTFRGDGGLWRQYRATDLATPEAFAQDSKLVWQFYNWRRELLAPLRPNPGHLALAAMEGRFSRFTLITQNIDGLHEISGSRNIIELHGNIWWVRCTGCGAVTEDRRVPLPELPACESCGSLLRPHVVWFGESLDPKILDLAYRATESCQLMMVIGTSGMVQPAASMGAAARRHGAFVSEINLEPTPYTGAYDLSILGKAGEVLPKLLEY
jgi:NAD-dependent deacetylase